MAEPVTPFSVSPQSSPPSAATSEPIALRQVTRIAAPHKIRAPRTNRQPWERGLSAIQSSWRNFTRAAAQSARRAQVRVRRLKDERPLETIAGVAAAAFLIGVGLRIWRSHHE